MISEEKRERLREQKRKWYLANREKTIARAGAYAAANKDQIRDYKRAHNVVNKERVTKQRRAYYEANKDDIKARSRAWAAANPERRIDVRLQRKYGITLTERQAMLVAQGTVCAICSSGNPGRKGWQTDHCHDTGKVRGILCNQCNTALGLFKDDPARLRSAATYLDRSKT